MTQLIRILGSRQWSQEARIVLPAAATFLAVAAFPLASVLLDRPVPGAAVTGLQEASAGSIVYFLRSVWPGTWLPVSQIGARLSDFQLGWSLAALGVIILVVAARVRRWPAVIMFLPAAALLLLLTPMPGLAEWLWSLVPAQVRNTTGNWAMNRLYLVTAAYVICAAQLLPPTARKRAWWVAVGCLALGWSGWEASKFVRGAYQKAREGLRATQLFAPENRLLTSYAYIIFPRHPSTFSHGVRHPLFEQRVIRPEDGRVLLEPAEVVHRSAEISNRLDQGRWEAAISAGDRLQAFPETLVLQPGELSVLRVEFESRALEGVLEIEGDAGFFRQYILPVSGSARAFGSGPESSPFLVLWTTRNQPVEVRFRFIHTQPATAATPAVLARWTRAVVREDQLPIILSSWLPFTAAVQAPTSGWLETSRMFVRGYRATVNGASVEVVASKDGLAAVPVPAGPSRVVMTYHPPWVLRLSFLISASALGVVLGWAVYRGLREFGRDAPRELKAA